MKPISNKILVTGGAGYIGSHTLIELVQAGFEPVVYDNPSNSSPLAVGRVEKIIGQPITFIEGDILDTARLEKTFVDHNFCRDTLCRAKSRGRVGSQTVMVLSK